MGYVTKKITERDDNNGLETSENVTDRRIFMRSMLKGFFLAWNHNTTQHNKLTLPMQFSPVARITH